MIPSRFFKTLMFSAFFLITAVLNLPASTLKQVETEHYIVVYTPGQEFYANEVIKVAEDIWDDLVTAYGMLKDYQKIHIYIRDPGDFANGMAIPGKNRVDIYTTNLEAGIRGTSNWIRNVISHEVSHVFSIKAANKDNFFSNFTVLTYSSYQNPDWYVGVQYRDLLAPMW